MQYQPLPGHENMLEKIKFALSDVIVRDAVTEALTALFQKLGVEQAHELAVYIVTLLIDTGDIVLADQQIYRKLEQTKIDGIPLAQIIRQQHRDYATQVFAHVREFFKSDEKIVHWSCGSCLITDLLYRNVSRNIRGYEVAIRPFSGVNSSLTISAFVAGQKISRLGDGWFNAALLTDALHREEKPEAILRELKRLIKPGGRLVVVEPTILTDDKMEKEIAFVMNWFALWPLNFTAVPTQKFDTAGVSRTKEAWMDIFHEVGFKIYDSDMDGGNPRALDVKGMMGTTRTFFVLRHEG